MLNLVKELCALPGVASFEDEVRDFLKIRAAGLADEVRVDTMGNLIVFKRGRKPAGRKLALCAHMDEVGLCLLYTSVLRLFLCADVWYAGCVDGISGVRYTGLSGLSSPFCVGGSGMAGIPCPGDPTFGGAEKDASLWKNLFFALWPVCLRAMCVCLPGVCRCAGSGGRYGGAVPALTAGRSR